MSHPVVPDQAGPDGERVIGIIDLGSNSLRLMLVRILPDGSHTVLNQVKNMVRLGEGAFETGHLREESMARTINVLRGMAEMCGVYGASEVIAIATAAVRDAANGPDFMRRVKEKTGIDFRVVSGREEARLIYLGVSSGLAHTESLRLFIDIGGGSTELVVGNSEEYRNLDSLKMGCVRLSNLFFDKDSGTISAKRYAALQNYIRNNALRSFQRIADFVIEEAVASSGTAQNLAEIAAALDAEDAARTGRAPQESRDVLSYGGLRRAVKELCGRTLKERRSVPGINPNRADVIVAGAAILQTIMEDQGFDSVRISNRNLQNGILVDYLSTRMPHADGSFHPVRKESVLHLARRCRFEERHSRHVSRLALDLFDSAKAMGLHDSGDLARELLHYAALLHDIGIFISFSRHNAHSHYLIRNTELLGFTRREVDIMAASVPPRKCRCSWSSTRRPARRSACSPSSCCWPSAWTRAIARSCAPSASRPARKAACSSRCALPRNAPSSWIWCAAAPSWCAKSSGRRSPWRWSAASAADPAHPAICHVRGPARRGAFFFTGANANRHGFAMSRGAGRCILPGNHPPEVLPMDDAQHSLQRKLEQERRHLACLCAGFALPHGHGDEADNARDEMAELLAWSHANLCAARIRALEGLLGDLRCSGRRLCMDCGEEIPLSRLLAVPGACRCRDCQQLAEEEGPVCDQRPPLLPEGLLPLAAPLR